MTTIPDEAVRAAMKAMGANDGDWLAYAAALEAAYPAIRAQVRAELFGELRVIAANEHEGMTGPWPEGVNQLVVDWLYDQEEAADAE